jgi:hypothetical protein
MEVTRTITTAALARIVKSVGRWARKRGGSESSELR